MKVKVCGMKYADNIREVAGLLPDYLGFIFYTGSKRYVGKKFGPEKLQGLPSSIKRVGVFVNSTKTYVLQKVMEYRLDYVQLHGDESPGFCESLCSSVKIIKAFGLSDNFDFAVLSKYRPYCSYFLFDTKTPVYGGSGKVFNWDVLKKYDNKVPFFLSGGLTPVNIMAVKKLKGLNIHAIDVNSGFESVPGIKDIAKLKKIK